MSSKNAVANVIFWIDCEMTGLGENDELIEIAIIPTNMNLEYLDNDHENHGISLVIKPTENGLNLLNENDFVLKMHKNSGLINELDSGLSLLEATNIVYDYIIKYEPKQKAGLIGGNSVHADKRFIDKYMPKVSEHLHYRLIDVSTIKELAKSWYPEIIENAVKKNNEHRALGDIIESIEELKNYRKNVFK